MKAFAELTGDDNPIHLDEGMMDGEIALSFSSPFSLSLSLSLYLSISLSLSLPLLLSLFQFEGNLVPLPSSFTTPLRLPHALTRTYTHTPLPPKDVAKGTRFGGRIAHGLLSASAIGTVFGTYIPGCVYLNQDLKFKAPVMVGDSVKTTVKVEKILSKRIVICSTTCVRSDGTTVIEGQASVLIPQLDLERSEARR